MATQAERVTAFLDTVAEVVIDNYQKGDRRSHNDKKQVYSSLVHAQGRALYRLGRVAWQTVDDVHGAVVDEPA